MGAYESWQNQREKLRTALAEVAEGSSASYLVRHALSQTEQDTLSAITDDTLRQQTGVLFSCLKNAAGFLDVTVSAKEWQMRAQPKEKGKPTWLILAAAAILQVLIGLHFYTKGETVVWIVMLAALLLTAVYLLVSARSRKEKPKDEELRITLHPDAEKLLTILDAQLRAIDRFMSDLQFLNEKLSQQSGQAGLGLAQVASELMEQLCELDGDAREQALSAADKLLDGLGMEAVEYSEHDKRLFTVLPSKQATRTLTPALVSKDSRRLLKTGTAAVSEA